MGIDLEYYGEDLDIRSALSGSDLVVDALIGYSLNGNPRPPVSEIIDVANESGTRKQSKRSGTYR